MLANCSLMVAKDKGGNWAIWGTNSWELFRCWDLKVFNGNANGLYENSTVYNIMNYSIFRNVRI